MASNETHLRRETVNRSSGISTLVPVGASWCQWCQFVALMQAYRPEYRGVPYCTLLYRVYIRVYWSVSSVIRPYRLYPSVPVEPTPAHLLHYLCTLGGVTARRRHLCPPGPPHCPSTHQTPLPILAHPCPPTFKPVVTTIPPPMKVPHPQQSPQNGTSCMVVYGRVWSLSLHTSFSLPPLIFLISYHTE